MEFRIDKFNTAETVAGNTTPATVSSSNKINRPLFEKTEPSQPLDNEITMMRDVEIYADRIKDDDGRSKYLKKTTHPKHKVQKGEYPDKIAKKYGIETNTLLAANGMDSTTAKNIHIGDELTIPPTITVKNVKTLGDVAGAMGLSKNFILRLKRMEDGTNMGDNEFHNTPYKDKAGVLTIGIGHVVKPGDKQKLSNEEVCTLLVQDLLKVEENLMYIMGGKENYDKIPQALKEALIDMAFNKGTSVIEKTDGLLWCLKNGKYEAAINKLTFNKSTETGKEMSGLSKRRLFDLSVAIRMYEGKKIPQSNLNTIQNVYNRGVELLRQECAAKNLNFTHQLNGFNKDIQEYFGDKVKIKLVSA